MEAVTDSTVRRLTLMCPTQLMKTEVLLNAIAYYVHQDPCPILMVQPTDHLAEEFSKQRIDPMLRDSPVLTDLVHDRKSRDAGNTIAFKKFEGGYLAITGAETPGKLASKPVRLVLCDEIDKYKSDIKGEGNPVDLAAKRQSTFWNSLLIEACSPTEEDTSQIAKSYDRSDKRVFEVACHECDEYQVLDWAQVTYPVNEPHLAELECIKCACRWNEPQRLKNIANRSRWRATAPFKGHAGFHCNKLSSPWETVGELAAEYEEVRDDIDRLKVFTNTVLAKVWKNPGMAPESQRLYERRKPYERNKVPPEGIFLTAGVDVQGNRLEVEIVAWGPRKVSWSLDYRVLAGDPGKEEVWNQLSDILYSEFECEDGSMIGIEKMAVDSGGNHTQIVYDWCRRHPTSMAVKGFDHLTTILGTVKPVDIRPDGKTVRGSVLLWPVGSSHIKKQLYSWLLLDEPALNEPFPIGYMHFPEYDLAYFEMLTSEKLVIKTVKGYPKSEWVLASGKRNESLDCKVYNRAAAHTIGIDRIREEDWGKFSRRAKFSPRKPDKLPIRKRPGKKKKRRSMI